MSTAALPRLYTAADLLAMPDDGVERWLIRGELRERSKTMTVRNRFHSKIMAMIAHLLNGWLDGLPVPRGEVLCGEAGVHLLREPDTTFGIDVIYISAETAKAQSNDTTIVEGVPVLAVEILSPSDKQEEVDDKIDAFLQAGVAVVWIVDPHDRTVTVYRPGSRPQLFTIDHELTAEPQLPGFRAAVARLFE